jgi:hypothetical protein
MAITYPVSVPTSIGLNQVTFYADNADAMTESPFSYSSQVFKHTGERWRASVSVAPFKKELSEPWVAFLLSLRGRSGTFLLGDPARTTPQGTATSATLTGVAGSSSPTITMTGSLLAGDYIQLGSGSDTTLHKVLVNRSGTGVVEIWPRLRKNRTSVAVVITNTRGLFRLSSGVASWGINEMSTYGITFDCVEAL